MGDSITLKILRNHLVEGSLEQDGEIGIRVDQTLTQDTTGTMAYLAFETLGLKRVQTELSVSYVDHNTIQTDFRNADDHRYLQNIAKKYGLRFSKPGNGICHSLHYQRFAKPGKTLIGSDSHTPTSGAVGTLAIGAGGMSVAMAMAGEPFYLKKPKVVNVRLTGALKPGAASKDIILDILRRLSVKGGLGKVFEYTGPGVETLTVPERATIANMGAELGATTSVFPSDERVRQFLTAQGRGQDWVLLLPDEDAFYDDTVEIALDQLEPLIATPHMPDKVIPVKEAHDITVDQVFIGSCTNASYQDIAKAAVILDGRTVHPNVSMSVAPGSIQVMEMLIRDGILQKLVAAGVRVLESACGPCVGVGQAPCSEGVSLRTSNRNFIGRSGTADANVYLCSPEVAAASAVMGRIVLPGEVIDASTLADVHESSEYIINDRMILSSYEPEAEIHRGPNIKPMPVRGAMETVIEAEAVLKVGDNITTDDIMPAGSKILSLRSNVPAISEYVFNGVAPDFPERARCAGKSIIVAGENYGQGSSREHAALAPMHLGVQALLAKSIARIHFDNLINYGILPLVFSDPKDYDSIEETDCLRIEAGPDSLAKGEINVINLKTGQSIKTKIQVSERQIETLLAGGQLNYVRDRSAKRNA